MSTVLQDIFSIFPNFFIFFVFSRFLNLSFFSPNFFDFSICHSSVVQPIPPNRLAAITLSLQVEFAFSTFLYVFRPFNYFTESSSVSNSQKLQKKDCPFQVIPFAQTSLAAALLHLACSQPLPQRALCPCLHAVLTFQGVVRFPQKKDCNLLQSLGVMQIITQ